MPFHKVTQFLSTKNVLNALVSAIFAISFTPNITALKNQLEIGTRL